MKVSSLALVAIMVAALICVNHAGAVVIPETSLVPDYDGFVQQVNATAYTRTTGQIYLRTRLDAAPDQYNAWMRWDITSIPDNSTILDVTISLRTVAVTASNSIDFTRITGGNPQTQTDADLYLDDTTNVYVTQAVVQNTAYNVNLGAQSLLDIDAQLVSNWYAVGFYTSGTSATDFHSSASATPAYRPILRVRYSYLGIVYIFQSRWENSTNYYPKVITVISSTSTDTITLTTAAAYPFTERPIACSWVTGSGDTRYQYFVADSGTVTVYEPVGAEYNYQFSIKDYASKLTGTCYLECYTLGLVNQRVPITPGNPPNLNLQINKSYNIQIRLSGGTQYNWGNFVAATSLTPTIIIRGVTFDKQVYTASQFIQVEVTRVGGTITVDYLDMQSGTIWANVTIAVRNGGVVNIQPQNANSFTYNYVGNASVPYVVNINGENTYLPTWGYTKILDEAKTFPPAPTLTGIWTFGGIDMAYAFGTAISVSIMGLFSYAHRRVGTIAGAAVASLLTYIGWTGWSYYLLAVVWLVAGAVALTGGGGD